MSSDTKHGEPPTLPGHPARGFVAEPGQSKAAEEAARLADAERSSAADATRKGGSTSKSVAEHVRRDIRLAQAYNLVQNGDYWMSQPSEPTPLIKYSSASRLYEDAADIFRAYGRWRYAGEAYAKAGEAERRMNAPLVAASYFVDGGDCMERVDVLEAVHFYGRAVALYAVLGRFVSAATTQLRVAEIYEADGAHFQAAEAFQFAADYFIGDDLYIPTCQALYRAGVCLCAEGGSWREASEKFDRAAYFAADHNLAKLRVPAFMLDAGLCLLADGDLEGVEDYVVECCKRSEEFSVGREKRFLLDTVDVARAALLDDFVDHCWNFDFVAGLAPHELQILELLLNRIAQGPLRDREKARSDGFEEVTEEKVYDEYGNEKTKNAGLV
jgi:alpha-soluble NSF attachment protein